jgi:hypothetical protein
VPRKVCRPVNSTATGCETTNPPTTLSATHAARKRGAGRPPARRPLQWDDRRRRYELASAYAKAADRAGLLLMARLDFDTATLVAADSFYRTSKHWGETKATLLPKNVGPPRRPDTEDKRDLLDWAHRHVCTRRLTGKARCLKVSDSLYTKPRGASLGFFPDKAWSILVLWLKCIAANRCRLTYDTRLGFGLVALVPFAPGDIIVRGKWWTTRRGRGGTRSFAVPHPFVRDRCRRLRKCRARLPHTKAQGGERHDTWTGLANQLQLWTMRERHV